MWYPQPQRPLRRPELKGLIARPLPIVTGALTVPIKRKVSAPVAAARRGTFRARRRAREAKAAQLWRDGGESRIALRQEARFLFGSGKDRHDQLSGLDWDGERVMVH